MTTRLYTIVLRGPSGAMWPPGRHFTVGSFPSASGKVEIVLQTRRVATPNFSKPEPRGIHVQVVGPADSLDQALANFTAFAELITPVVSLVANAPIGLLETELAYESTPGLIEREFFQQFLPDERVLPVDLHEVPNPALKAVLESLPKHPDTDRIHRAMSYYHTALGQWRPGSELAVLSYLYMGVEALTPPMLRATLRSSTMTRQELLKAWGIEPKQLDSEVRRRVIFRGDSATYGKAKGASDGLEHGFAPFTQIHADAASVVLPTAQYLRTAILGLLELPFEIAAQLFAPPYDEPFFLYYTKYLRGILISVTDDLAAPDQLYPILQWRSTRKEQPTEPAADPKVVYEDRIHLKAASGVSFKEAAVYVFGPKGKGVARVDIPRDGT